VLYDNVRDPYQLKNLASDPASQPMIEKFNVALLAWGTQTGDTFPYETAFKSVSAYPGT
jgi:hypothetical protein